MSDAPVEVLITVAFKDDQIDQLRQLSPRLNIRTQTAKAPEEISPEIWEHVEILYTDRLTPLPNSVPKLKWVQYHYAGVDHVASAPLLHDPRITITTISGAASPQVAEHAMMMMLALGHKIPDLHALQAKSEWPRDRWERLKPVELRGSTVGLVGYGSIGREIARLLQPFGVRVLAVKRDAMHPQDNDYEIEGYGDPHGDLFTRLYPGEAVHSMMKECDFVVVCVPLTTETRRLIGKDEIAEMKPGAFLVDVSRGGVIDQSALIEALQDKKIGGAALDVFPEEPLPATNPLWKLPNVLISPHISGISPYYNSRAITAFAANLRRYLAEQPLINRFDPERGY
jgi:phosphoglycerate dehydrogenase-like enzyme